MKHITIYSLMLKMIRTVEEKLRSESVCWLNLLLRKVLIPMIRLYSKQKGC